jgi:hypothetical protein
MLDQVLIGQDAIANFLTIERRWLREMHKHTPGGVPHVVIGKNWISTTHTIMSWLATLAAERAVIPYKPGDGRRWKPSLEVLKKFDAGMVSNKINQAREARIKAQIKTR